MKRTVLNRVVQVQHFFERSVDAFPNNTALVCDGVELSYKELEGRANQLAHYLQSLGLTSTDTIGILLERSLESYVSILAVLKIGATYVPLEVEHPDERLSYIFSDMHFHAVITTSSQSIRKITTCPKSIVLDKVLKKIDKQPLGRPVLIGKPCDDEQLCYVIYTSGSTGKPKGVEITHRSICHYIHEASSIYEMTAEDRVYQGFSLAFDASLEEMWMAFANGGALIACTSKDTRSGVLLIEFLQQHRVSFFSTVPTLLSTIEGSLPHLRLLVLGGEACSLGLVNRWYRPGLKIFNTYGPTEATVIATYSQCQEGAPVTIGRPLPGYDILVLDANLQPVAQGVPGELCIGGIGLARGYVNRLDMTASKFVQNPNNPSQRLYRTGDLATVTVHGDIQFLGRLDDQIKLRGFRIELNEIETVMMAYQAITQAVVSLQELECPTLVAYLSVDKKNQFNVEQFKLFLQEKLPRFMIPTLFELVESFPLLASGKVNRKALPAPKHAIRQEKEYIAPMSAIEKDIAEIWEAAMQSGPISITADFFYDLGGHSLLAAKVVSNLRKMPALQNISILDIYQNPSIKQLALKFSEIGAQSTQRPSGGNHQRNTTPSWVYFLCMVGQFFGCLLQYAISAWQLLAVVICYSFVTEKNTLLSWQSLEIFLFLFLVMPIASVLISIGSKWLLLGRVKPGRYRLWGWFYLRWWMVQRLQKNIFSPKHMIGSPLIVFYYRLLGAKIGKNCYIGTINLSTFDQLSIGDDTSIGYDASLPGYIVEDGWLKIGTVTIGKHCFVGARSVVSMNTSIEDDAALDHMSMLPVDRVIRRGQFFSGSPATLSIVPPNHVTNHKKTENHQTLARTIWYGLLHYICMEFALCIYLLCFIPCIVLVSYFYEQSHYLITILFATPLGAITFMALYYMSIFTCKKIIINKIKPGTYALQSIYYLRQWTIVRMMDIDEIGVLADSLYLPLFLRSLGAKIGKRVEMGETPHVIPDLVSIRDGGFTASSVGMAWPDVYNGSATFAPVMIGSRGFVGNGSILPSGAEIGDGSLLGCMSMTPSNNEAAEANTAWLGSPAVFLPKRELFHGFSEEETYNPTKRTYCLRLAIEFARIIMPMTFSLMLLFNLLYVLDYLLGNYSLLTTFLVIPIAEILIILGIIALIVAMKWIMLGRIKPSITPIWNSFIWKNDVREYSYNYFVNKYFTNVVLGTPFVSILFRCMGATIGKRLFTDSNLFAEFDLITIGDDVCINSETRIQTHLYEDRIFKLSNLVIKDGCSIGDASIVLYDTVMENYSTLGSLSLLMKGEILPANTHWEGIPAQSTNVVYHYHGAEEQRASLENRSIRSEPELDVTE